MRSVVEIIDLKPNDNININKSDTTPATAAGLSYKDKSAGGNHRFYNNSTSDQNNNPNHPTATHTHSTASHGYEPGSSSWPSMR